VNPKNLALCVSGGVAVGTGSLSGGQAVVAVAAFVAVAASTVTLPVLCYLVARDDMRYLLDALHRWLVEKTTVIAVLLSVIGVVLIGNGVGGL
jgi:Sap, sulfolipid-1-addressing protein